MKVLLEAPILTQSGYGEHARLVYESLKSQPGLEIHTVPLQWGVTSWVTDLDQDIENSIKKFHEYTNNCKKNNQKPSYDIQVHVGIPNEFEKKAQYSVMVTAGIETDRVSWSWILKTHQGIDKIIVPSQHAKEIYSGTKYEVFNKANNTKSEVGCNAPIDVIPYPIKEITPEELDLDFETSFNFLNIGLFGVRKNIEQSIEWFIKEFKDESDVGLVLKTGMAKGTLLDRQNTLAAVKKITEKYPDRKCKVYLLHGNMNEGEIQSLYNHPKIKALISTTHGEGYGLPIFEAAYNALPVVVTDWSGHLDFLSAPVKNKKSGKIKNKKLFAAVEYEMKQIAKEASWKDIINEDSSWAYPTEFSFKTQIKKVYKNYSLYKSWAKKLKDHINTTHKKEDILDLMKSSILGPYASKLQPAVKIEDLPKISLVTSVFKANDYIEQLMEDITRQTVFKDKCEWIILNANPAGEDFDEEVILKYKDMYPDNIIYEKMEEDPGIYDTWNRGIMMATGDYVTNVNCDDRRRFDGLEKQAAMLYSNPDVDLVYNDSYITHEPNIMYEDVPADCQKYNFEEFSVEAMLRGNLPHNNPMWRREIHDKNGYFNQYYKSAGDWDFWLRCAFNGSKFMKHPEILGVYYWNPVGMSTNPEHDSWKKVHEREIFTNYMNMYQERQSKAS